jgi:WD40 repeat protein
LLLSLAVSAKGRVLAGTGTGALLVLETGEVRTLVGHAAPVNGVSFAGDDEVAVTSDELELRFWPIEVSGAEVIGERDRDGVFALAVLADGKTVVIGKRSGRLRRSTLDGRMEELGDEGEFVFLAASIGSPAWASGGTRLRVWGEGVSPLAEKPLGGELAGLAVSPDGRWVAAATSEPAVLLFGEKGDLRRPGLAGTRHLAWAPDSKRLAIAAENHVRVLHVETGAEIDLGGHQGTVFRVAWHPSGEWLATGALDRTARLWDTHGDSQILPHGALVAALVFTPRGRLVTSSWDQLVRAWEVDGSGPRTFPGHTGHIFDIAASPDGTHAATASRDGTARLWDLTSGSARVLRGHEGPVKRVAFADGGRILVTAGDDGTVRLWPVGVDEQAVDAVSFRRQLDALTTVVIDGEGRARTPAAVSR